MNKFGRKTSVVDNLFFLRNSLAYGRQIYFYRLKLVSAISCCLSAKKVISYTTLCKNTGKITQESLFVEKSAEGVSG